MGVRVRVALAPATGSPPFETVAVCSSGFEADRCEIVVPAAAADRLGLTPRSPGARLDRY